MSGQIAERLPPGAEAIDKFRAEQAWLLSVSHDQAAIVPQRPQPPQVGGAERAIALVHNQGLPDCSRDTQLDGCFQSWPVLIAQKSQLRKLPAEVCGDLRRLVAGSIVNDENLEPTCQVGEDVEQFLHLPSKGAFGVSYRKNDAQRVFHEGRPWCAPGMAMTVLTLYRLCDLGLTKSRKWIHDVGVHAVAAVLLNAPGGGERG